MYDFHPSHIINVSPPIRCYRPHLSYYRRLLLLLSPKANTQFYRPAEGGRLSRRRRCNKDVQPKAVHRSDNVINTTACGGWDLILESLTVKLGTCKVVADGGLALSRHYTAVWNSFMS